MDRLRCRHHGNFVGAGLGANHVGLRAKRLAFAKPVAVSVA